MRPISRPRAPRPRPRATRSCSLATLWLAWPLRLALVALTHAALGRVRIGARALGAIAVVATLVAVVSGPAARQVWKKLEVYAGLGADASPTAHAHAPTATAPTATAPTATTPTATAPTATAPTATAPTPSAASETVASTVWRSPDTSSFVAETRVLDFARMSHKLMGSPLLVVLAALGVLLALAWRPSLFPLGLVAVPGLFAFVGGYRFLVYLAPVLFFGLAWLAARLCRALPSARMRALAAVALGVVAVGPSFDAIVPARDVRVSWTRPEAEALLALDAASSPDDLTIAWWDFGHPLTYFAKTRVITDGSRRGDDAALAAEILLTTSPARATGLARLAADAEALDPFAGPASVLRRIARARGLGSDAFLAAVEAGTFPAQPHRGEVFLYLWHRLLPILPALAATRLDAARSAYVRAWDQVHASDDVLRLGGGFTIDRTKVRMRRPDGAGGTQSKPLRALWVVSGSGATFQRTRVDGDPRAPTIGVFQRDLGVFVELDAALAASLWARLYLFEEGEALGWSPVLLTPTQKIYRLAAPLPSDGEIGHVPPR